MGRVYKQQVFISELLLRRHPRDSRDVTKGNYMFCKKMAYTPNGKNKSLAQWYFI